MYILLVIVGLAATATAKDVIIGDGGSLIYEQNATASPAIWRQANNLTINTTTPYEVITRVVIIDNRDDKDGEAAIVEGGVGHQNITIELKSPAVFRGYDFVIQIYAKQEDLQEIPQKPQANVQQIIPGLEKLPPRHEKHDDKGLVTPVATISSTTQLPTKAKVQHPILTNKDGEQQVLHNRDTQEQAEQKPLSRTPIDVNQNSIGHDQTVKDTKDFNPLSNNEDWQSIVDQIFSKNNSTEKIPVVEPLKPVLPIAHEPILDFKGDKHDTVKDKEVATSVKAVPGVKETDKKA